jgi:hypothetical protein
MATVVIKNLNLHSGLYTLDIWLGNKQEDFAHKAAAIIFEYQHPVIYTDAPDPLLIGSVDIPGHWSLQK